MKRATPPLIKEFNIQLRRQTYRISFSRKHSRRHSGSGVSEGCPGQSLRGRAL